MKKVLFICMVLYCAGYLLAPTVYAQEKDATVIVEQLNSELEKDGICTPEDLNRIKGQLKDMVNKGATKKDLKNTLRDLSNKGIKGEDLKNTVGSMNDLIKNGEDPKEAGNIVSRAAHQAQIEGLKGKELAARVHAAIKERKQERSRIRQEEMQQKMQQNMQQKMQQKQERAQIKQQSKGKAVGPKGK